MRGDGKFLLLVKFIFRWDNWFSKSANVTICDLDGTWDFEIDRVGKNKNPWNCNFGFYWSSRNIDDTIIFRVRCNNFMQQILCNQLAFDQLKGWFSMDGMIEKWSIKF